MPELRKDPITGRWVIISTDRAKRPSDFIRESVQIKGVGDVPVLPWERRENAIGDSRVRAKRQRQGHAGMVAARGAEQVSGAGDRRRPGPRGRGAIRSHERSGRARSDHRDPRTQIDTRIDARESRRGSVVGVSRPHAGSQERPPLPLHPAFQESRRSWPAPRWNTRTRN